MNHILTITDEAGAEVVKCRIENLDPMNSTLLVLKALADARKPRKPRSDRGVSRREQP